MQCSDPRRGSLCLPAGPEGWRLVLVPLVLMLGAAAGGWFYVVFAEAAEAVAVGVTMTSVALRVFEMLLRTVLVFVASCTRALMAKVKQLADTVHDFIDRFFGGFGGTAPYAVRAV